MEIAYCEMFSLYYRVRKILNARLFEDANGKRWQLGAKDAGLEILSVSQVCNAAAVKLYIFT